MPGEQPVLATKPLLGEMNSFFRLLVIGGFLIVIAALAGLTTLAGKSNQAFHNHTREIIQYNQVLYHTSQIRLLTTEMEASKRGYTVTRDSAFLRPYEAALPLLEQNMKELDTLLHAVPLGNEPGKTLRKLVERKISSTAEIINASNRSFEQARLLIASGNGKTIMDSIQHVTDAIDADVNARLVHTREIREEQIHKSRIQVIVIIVFVVLLLAFLFWLIDYNFRKRAKAESALKKSISEKENLYQNAPCGYLSIDGSGRFTRVNDTFLNFTGYTRDQLHNKLTIHDILTPESKQTWTNTTALHDGEPMTTVELDFITPHRGIFSGTASLRFSKNTPGKVRCSVIDANEKRKADQRVLELNRELEEFSYSVSHDLRTPLRLVNGYAHMLREDHPELITPESEEIIDVIINNASKMGMLIDDLLSFARIGRTESNATESDFRAIIDSTMVELLGGKNGHHVDLTIKSLTPVRSDVALMKQVWMNLLSNAIKYSSKNKEIKIEIGSFPRDGAVCYYVKDNGVGFNMSYQDKLFKVFQRLHREDEFPGTGVGLALVKKIVSRHGGTVWAESTQGEGATFYFTLPKSEL